MSKTMVDSAWPQPNFPATDVVLIYCGGDTPHPWTDTEIAAQKARFRLPCWVRSNPSSNLVGPDSNGMIAWLKAHNVPAGVVTMLDLETAIDANYVNGYGAALHGAGYLVMPYGSLSTLFGNPRLDGYFTAHYTGTAHLCSGALGTQWIDDTMLGQPWDLSLVSDTVPLWDMQPPPPPPPPPPTQVGAPYPIPGSDLMNVDWSTTTGHDGTAYVPVTIPPGCTHMVDASADVGYPVNGHHDVDLGDNALGKSGIVCQPAVPISGGKQFVRIAGGAPDHFYTGHSQFA